MNDTELLLAEVEVCVQVKKKVMNSHKFPFYYSQTWVFISFLGTYGNFARYVLLCFECVWMWMCVCEIEGVYMCA